MKNINPLTFTLLTCSLLSACSSGSSSSGSEDKIAAECVAFTQGNPGSYPLGDGRSSILTNQCSYAISVAYRTFTSFGPTPGIYTIDSLQAGQSEEVFNFNANDFIACKLPAKAKGEIDDEGQSKYSCD